MVVFHWQIICKEEIKTAEFAFSQPVIKLIRIWHSAVYIMQGEDIYTTRDGRPETIC